MNEKQRSYLSTDVAEGVEASQPRGASYLESPPSETAAVVETAAEETTKSNVIGYVLCVEAQLGEIVISDLEIYPSVQIAKDNARGDEILCVLQRVEETEAP